MQVDPEQVIARMAERAGRLIGQQLAEAAMRDVALEAAQARIAELEQAEASGS